MYVPDVPCLVDRAGTFRYAETNCAVVIYTIYCIWALVLRLPIFAMLRLKNLNAIAHLVVVRNSPGILAFVVVTNHTLSSFLEVLPIGLKAYVVDGVAAKH
jgi:DMSO/TMAO reductase YedYZ heme-binding membrane subunit